MVEKVGTLYRNDHEICFRRKCFLRENTGIVELTYSWRPVILYKNLQNMLQLYPILSVRKVRIYKRECLALLC